MAFPMGIHPYSGIFYALQHLFMEKIIIAEAEILLTSTRPKKFLLFKINPNPNESNRG